VPSPGEDKSDDEGDQTSGVRVSVSRLVLVMAMLIPTTLAVGGCGGGGETGSSTGDAAAASAKPQAGGVLNVAQGPEVISLDPQVAIDPVSINVLSQIMEPLYKANAEGKIEPWLATKATTSKNELTWTFALRRGVKFSNGEPLTAEDVVFSIDSARKGANWGALFEAVAAVEAPSPSTVVIKVKHPLPAMEALLSSYSTVVVPKNYGGVSEKEFAADPIGTGPFVLGPRKHGSSLTLTANPGYWKQGEPYLEKVVFDNVSDDNSRVSQLQGGELDVISSPPFSQIAMLEQDPGSRSANSPSAPPAT
jgi:peptide/nickel transport system substrate-binding protein